MLNLAVGTPGTVDGRSSLTTSVGKQGHAVYGPYEFLDPGRYAVEFGLALAGEPPAGGDFVCAVLDIAIDGGNRIVASRKVTVSQLRGGRTAFTLPFALKAPARAEYRVQVNGKVALLIDEHRSLVRLTGDAGDAALIEAGRFPEEEGAAVPFFSDYRVQLRQLYEQGVGVRIESGQVVLSVAGVSLHARCEDDIRFIGEVFFENAYNFKADGGLCAIDIGMNIGLSSLLFATKPEVAEVHSFEPFARTFDRATDNIALNPTIADKIHANAFGLSDQDYDGPVTVSQSDDSGAMSTIGAASGTAIEVSLRDAGAVLRPIVERARAAGRKVIVKVDCEGSEFPVFASLEAHGLLPLIAAFMVEWHAVFADKTQETLLAPLRRNGFLVFDRSPPRGNGFFYAVRTA